ncbi:MAG: hypothetical protein WBE74_14815, partial [Terracidiphilus sp.]
EENACKPHGMTISSGNSCSGKNHDAFALGLYCFRTRIRRRPLLRFFIGLALLNPSVELAQHQIHRLGQ